MIRLVLCCVLSVFVCLAPPVFAQDESDSASVQQELRQRIDGLLAELDGFGDVEITVRSGLVILEGEVVDPAAAERIESLIAGIDGVIGVENRVITSTALNKRLNPVAERLSVRLSQAVGYIPLALVALMAAGAVWVLGFFLARRIRFWRRIAPNAFIANIYRQLLRLIFVLAGIVLALDILGATALLGTILGAAGLVGLAIGFAVKDSVENFIASIMLSVRQPFRPNDLVLIEGHEGRVIRLTSRATILLNRDGNHVRIPNATVFKGLVVNFSSNPQRRFTFTLGVEPESDLVAVRDLMEDILRELPFTLNTPSVAVWIENINEGGVIFTLTGWIDQRETSIYRARGEALRAVKEAVEEAGAAIPDTTYRIRIEDQKAASNPQPTKSLSELRGTIRVQEVDAREERDLDGLIDAERAVPNDDDLLSENAGTE